MSDSVFDLIILGGGPGGYVAAIRAAQLGLNTALIEESKDLGGTCLHRGCIPTKALLHYTEALEALTYYTDFGIDVTLGKVDIPKMHRAKAKVVQRMARGIDGLMKKNGITVMKGRGRLTDKRVVDVGGRSVHGQHIILATGSQPLVLPFLPPPGQHIFTSDEILHHTAVPTSLAILGAGAVGLEFACIYQSLGSEVTVIEMADRVLPIEDEAISSELAKLLAQKGIKFHMSTRIERVEIQQGRVHLRGNNLTNSASIQIQAEALLSAVGRKPALDDLGLEPFHLDRDGPYLKVDARYQTRHDWLFAIGDIIPGPQLAHVASAEGIVCVEAIAGHTTHPIDYDKIPSATYCRPQVASVGLTESAARARGYEVAIGRFPWSALGKSAISGQTEGFIKIVSEAQYGEILGVHILGDHASDLIAEACLALSCEATVEELFRTVHAHPTLPEGLAEAAHGVFGQPIHLPPQRTRRTTS